MYILNPAYKIIVFLLVLCLCTCDKVKYYPDKEYHEVETKILAHRGGGGKYAPYQEYSPEGASYSMSVVGGIEVDLQISKDRTIWLCHNADLPDCGGTNYDCFPESTDKQIIALDSCNGEAQNFPKLEDIFKLMASKFPGKYISLDVKLWAPCAVTSANSLGVMNVIADKIIELTKKYQLQHFVLVESETATFLDYLQKNSKGIECHLTVLGDFEKGMQLALKAGYQGISFKYKFDEAIDTSHIQLLRKKGLKIQLWTVNSEEDLEEAISINPDFIQTDNISYFE